MEKSIEIVALTLISLAILSLLYYSLTSKSKLNGFSTELNEACLELVKNGCNENLVTLNSKGFERICEENGLNLVECKKYCGCQYE